MHKYLVRGRHSVSLASGRSVEPGESVAADDVNPKHPNDRRLLDEQVLIDVSGRPDNKEDK